MHGDYMYPEYIVAYRRVVNRSKKGVLGGLAARASTAAGGGMKADGARVSVPSDGDGFAAGAESEPEPSY